VIDIHRQGEVAGAVRELEGYAHRINRNQNTATISL